MVSFTPAVPRPGQCSGSDNAMKGCENKPRPITASIASYYSDQYLYFFFPSHNVIGADFLLEAQTMQPPCNGFR